MKRAFAAVAAFAGLAACGGLAASQSVRSISPSDKKLGAEAHPQLLEQFGGAYTGPQAKYVEQVGKRISVQSGLSNSQQDFTVTLLNSPVNNAFAVPGGYVYVTRQLLGLMNDEAELASVLGHEVGHVAARHSNKRNTTSTIGSILAAGVGILTGRSELGQLAGYGAQLYTLRFSRAQEYEADDLGIRYLRSAGYDPAAAADILASLNAISVVEARAQGSDGESVPTWASTHPNTADRVDRARKEAAKVSAGGSGARNRDAFLAAIDGMTYDDDPKQGVIQGQSFLHPDLRLAFTAPKGFAMTNSPAAVTIQGSGGQAQFQGGRLGNDGLAAYVGRVFQTAAGSGGAVNLSNVKTATVGSMPAAYATVRASSKSGPVDVTVFAYQYAPDTAYHFMTITPQGTGLGPFQSLTQSFRKLNTAEAKAVQPRRIDVITTKAGDTVTSLANRMAYPDYRLERFLALNGLGKNSTIRPGQKVKLVVAGG